MHTVLDAIIKCCTKFHHKKGNKNNYCDILLSQHDGLCGVLSQCVRMNHASLEADLHNNNYSFEECGLIPGVTFAWVVTIAS